MPPKKAAKPAFYFFMLDFMEEQKRKGANYGNMAQLAEAAGALWKEEQKRKGANYGNMAQVAEAAGALWKNASPEVRSKFEAIAAKEKAKARAPENKFTSNGYSFAEIEQQKLALAQAQENERTDIKNMITTNLIEEIPDLYIYVMDVNYYCQANDMYVIGEMSLLRFSIRNGIKECYHEIINPGRIPVGYVSDVKYGSQELGLDMPDENVKRSNYMQILANIIDYLKHQDPTNDVLPPIFTMPDKVVPVVNFISQMCRQAGEDDSLFRVYQLDFLFYTLINAIKNEPDEGFPKESLALAQFKKDPFKYTAGISCPHHEGGDKYLECSLSRAKRWAYTILDSCCPVAGVKAVPGLHVPADFDLETFQVFQEQKTKRQPPTVAEPTVFQEQKTKRQPPTVAGPTKPAWESIRSDSSCSSVSRVEKESVVSIPKTSSASMVGKESLPRIPSPNFYHTHPSVTIAPALTLDDENFPPMGSSRGMGRGRRSDTNSLSSFEKLNLNK